MHRLLNSPLFIASMCLLLLAGILLLVISSWLGPLQAGERAARTGQYEQALEHYAAAEARFEQLPVMQQVLPQAYTASLTNQFRLLYRLGETDTLLDKAAGSPSLHGVHIWAGSALFNRALERTERKAKLAMLRRASAEFRSALEIAPGDWDTKYNYELAERLIAELSDEPDPPPMQLLRPKPREGEEPSQPSG